MVSRSQNKHVQSLFITHHVSKSKDIACNNVLVFLLLIFCHLHVNYTPDRFCFVAYNTYKTLIPHGLSKTMSLKRRLRTQMQTLDWSCGRLHHFTNLHIKPMFIENEVVMHKIYIKQWPIFNIFRLCFLRQIFNCVIFTQHLDGTFKLVSRYVATIWWSRFIQMNQLYT